MEKATTEETQGGLYEVTFFTRVDDAAPVRRAIEALRGVVLREQPFEKVRFAYPIRKESYAFMGRIEFIVDPGVFPELSRTLSLEEGVLRFLIHKAPAPHREAIGTPPKPPATKAPFPRSRRAPEALLTNEALEKKIEEILQ